MANNNQTDRPRPVRSHSIDNQDDLCGSAHHQKPTPSKNIIKNKSKHTHRFSIPFALFMFAIIVPFLLAYWYLFRDEQSAFIVSGIWGICLSLFALKHFLSLLKLRKAVSKYAQCNRMFKKENLCLHIEVDNLTTAKNGLNAIHKTFTRLNEKQKENLKTFRDIECNMKVANLNNIEGIGNVRDKVHHIIARLEDIQRGRERDVLFKVFNRLESGQNGLNRQDFDEFTSMIPDDYKQRFERLGSFNKLCGGRDVIDAEDFKLCLDVFADMKVDGVKNDVFVTEFTKRRSGILMQKKKSKVTNPFAIALLEKVSPSPEVKDENKEEDDDDENGVYPLFIRQSISETSKSYY